MKKLIDGIIDFRENRQESVKHTFAKLALGQKPDALLIACSDSRVVPNLFASTNPGDLFVVRNIGNLVPPATSASATAGNSVAAALEFSTTQLPVKDIVICGHSECGAMHAILNQKSFQPLQGLSTWLRHGHPSLERLAQSPIQSPFQEPHNQLALVNVLQQMDHVRSYPHIAEGLENKSLRIHGWFFNIAQAEVLAYVPDENVFVPIDADYASRFFST